jgi:hypothetical protein
MVRTVYDDLEIRGIKITAFYKDGKKGDIMAHLVINNKGRQNFRKGTIVNKVGNHLENQTRVWVFPFGPVTKEIVMLKNVEIPNKIEEIKLRLLFFDPSKERGLSVGGKVFEIDFTDAEVEYLEL